MNKFPYKCCLDIKKEKLKEKKQKKTIKRKLGLKV